MASPILPNPNPYYPTPLTLPTHYVENTLSRTALVGTISSLLLAALGTGWLVMGVLNTSMKRAAKASAAWFLISGLLHLHFEGYYIRHRHTLASSLALPAQLWKHYALSDSRYVALDPFVVGVEQLTVLLVGPLCLVTWAAGVFGSVYYHPLRLVVCVCHFYGCLLYFVTAEGGRHSRPESVYRWGYLVGMNVPWVVVPALLGWRSVRRIVDAVGVAEEAKRVMERRKWQ